MERTYELNQQEIRQAAQLQQENERLLMRYGSATLELEACRNLLPKVQEKQRDLVSAAVQRQGVTNFIGARIEGNSLVCQMPDMSLDAPGVAVMDSAGGKPNGAPVPIAVPDPTKKQQPVKE